MYTPWCPIRNPGHFFLLQHLCQYIMLLSIYAYIYIFIYLVIYNYADAADHEDEAANDADAVAKNLPCL